MTTTTNTTNPTWTTDPLRGDRAITTSVQLGDDTWRVSLHSDRESRVRAYIWDAEVNLPAPPPSVRGEDPELDARWDAYNRTEIAVERAYLVEILALAGIVATAAKFSRKAGCSCGCSPGFNFPTTYAPIVVNDTRYHSIFVSKVK